MLSVRETIRLEWHVARRYTHTQPVPLPSNMADVIGSANRGDLVSNARPSAIRFKSRWSSTPYGGRKMAGFMWHRCEAII
ncbi:hypothetical protein HBH56_072880 [Parastagonospora nodorum]|nr:hypothetical protein HBH56_072880 [Parastagonospora nodorum]KAH3927284.1 hypothetical protein HBH54_153120 [Parastagonospora nodorum]KAH4621099.1 hypothetical protein HBH55_161790 [Parastagonospora nodorum]